MVEIFVEVPIITKREEVVEVERINEVACENRYWQQDLKLVAGRGNIHRAPWKSSLEEDSSEGYQVEHLSLIEADAILGSAIT